MTGRPRARLAGFILAGAAAFLVDAGSTQVLSALGLAPALARLIALPPAVATGFLLNRRLTFADGDRERSGAAVFARYAATNAVALGVNYAVFLAVLAAWPGLAPAVAVAAGSAAALAVSYLGYDRLVFRPRRDP
jgi:putative flippase GtrA